MIFVNKLESVMSDTSDLKGLEDYVSLQAALDVAEKAIYGCIQPNFQNLCDRTFGLFTTVDGCDNIVLEACFQKTNPLYGILRSGPLTCRVVLSAVYGSPPSIFKSTSEICEASASWSFVVAQFFGTIEIVPDKELLFLLNRQIEQFEDSYESDWRLRDTTECYREQLLEAVFGLHLKCERAYTQYKNDPKCPVDQTVMIGWKHILNRRYDALDCWMNH